MSWASKSKDILLVGVEDLFNIEELNFIKLKALTNLIIQNYLTH